jgi:hypothetical protein
MIIMKNDNNDNDNNGNFIKYFLYIHIGYNRKSLL